MRTRSVKAAAGWVVLLLLSSGDHAAIGAQKAVAGGLTALELSANKTDLEIFTFPLNETFSPTRLAYTATVDPSYTASIFIKATAAAGPAASLKMNGQEAASGVPLKVGLKLGDNPFTVEVKAPDGAAYYRSGPR